MLRYHRQALSNYPDYNLNYNEVQNDLKKFSPSLKDLLEEKNNFKSAKKYEYDIDHFEIVVQCDLIDQNYPKK